MRTTVELPDHVLRRAKAEAALAGVKLKDFITEALKARLAEIDCSGERPAPAVEMRQVGQFRIPVTRSTHPGSVSVSPDQLAEFDLAEDLEKQPSA